MKYNMSHFQSSYTLSHDQGFKKVMGFLLGMASGQQSWPKEMLKSLYVTNLCHVR